jgi:hypothetical protein
MNRTGKERFDPTPKPGVLLTLELALDHPGKERFDPTPKLRLASLK